MENFLYPEPTQKQLMMMPHSVVCISMFEKLNSMVIRRKVLNAIGQKDLEVKKTWRLNERHYGGLTGLNKAETAAKHGEEQVKIWRRSFDVPPPTMEKDHPYYDTIVNDPRYFEQ